VIIRSAMIRCAVQPKADEERYFRRMHLRADDVQDVGLEVAQDV